MKTKTFYSYHNRKSSVDEDFVKYASISLSDTPLSVFGFHCGLLSLSIRTEMGEKFDQNFIEERERTITRANAFEKVVPVHDILNHAIFHCQTILQIEFLTTFQLFEG